MELGAKTERVVKMILDVARPTSSLQHVNVDKVVQRYMTAKSQNLGDYPYHIEVSSSTLSFPTTLISRFKQLFRKIATDAMSGLAISHEDLADLLSLKDNADEEIEDYVEAVQVCRVIPKVRTMLCLSLMALIKCLPARRQYEKSANNLLAVSLAAYMATRRVGQNAHSFGHDADFRSQSWTDIADTSKQTDEEVQERRTATAAFQLIKATREGGRQGLELVRGISLILIVQTFPRNTCCRLK